MYIFMKDLSISLICSIPSVIAAFYYFITFMEWNRKRRFVWTLWLLCFSNDYFVLFINQRINARWLISILTFAIVLIISMFFESEGVVKLVFSIMYTSIQILLFSLVINGLNVIYNTSVSAQYYASSIISRVLLSILILLLHICMKNSYVGKLSWKINCLLIIIPIGSMKIIQSIFLKSYIINILGIEGIVCIFCILIMNAIVFIIYNRLSENLEIKYKNKLYEKEFELLSVHEKEKETYMSEFRQQRHDLKHRMTELLLLLQEKQYDKVENSIRKLADIGSLDGEKISYTGNSIVDSFVNHKYEIALRNHINFNVQLDIPRELPFSNADVCVVLGNILDNALEACMRGDIQDPFIDLLMKYDGDNLVISIKNSFDGKIKYNKGKLVTRKEDKRSHGIGVSSIKNIVKKNNGYYNAVVHDNLYILNVLMYG